MVDPLPEAEDIAHVYLTIEEPVRFGDVERYDVLVLNDEAIGCNLGLAQRTDPLTEIGIELRELGEQAGHHDDLADAPRTVLSPFPVARVAKSSRIGDVQKRDAVVTLEIAEYALQPLLQERVPRGLRGDVEGVIDRSKPKLNLVSFEQRAGRQDSPTKLALLYPSKGFEAPDPRVIVAVERVGVGEQRHDHQRQEGDRGPGEKPCSTPHAPAAPASVSCRSTGRWPRPSTARSSSTRPATERVAGSDASGLI